jgi:alpha-N-arabinofuranosidase
MQQNTIRDACAAALTLDLFNNHADKLFMANIAQLINVLQSLLLVEEEKCIKTPTYHVFDLYRPHRNAQAVRFLSHADILTDGGASAQHCQSCYLEPAPFALQAVHGSASVKDGLLCITLVNTHPTQAVELDLEVYHSKLDEVELVTLAADDIHAHNTFEQPDVIKLTQPVILKVHGDVVRTPLPAGSVVRLIGSLR